MIEFERLTESLILGICSDLEYALRATAAFRRELINLGTEIIAYLCFVRVKPRPLPNDGITLSTKTIKGQFKSNNTALEVLVVLGFRLVGPSIELLRWNVIAVRLSCSKG